MVLITSENIKLWKLYEKNLNLQLYEKNNDFECILGSRW